MRLALIGCCLALGMAGCNRQDRVEAGNQAERAAGEAERALKNAGATLSDSSITMKVKSAMSVSDKLKSTGIDVDTKNKVVYLRGTVPDESQRALAERIAADTVGNDIRVFNELKVETKIDSGKARKQGSM